MVEKVASTGLPERLWGPGPACTFCSVAFPSREGGTLAASLGGRTLPLSGHSHMVTTLGGTQGKSHHRWSALGCRRWGRVRAAGAPTPVSEGQASS